MKSLMFNNIEPLTVVGSTYFPSGRFNVWKYSKDYLHNTPLMWFM